jgi:hypothetical protein
VNTSTDAGVQSAREDIVQLLLSEVGSVWGSVKLDVREITLPNAEMLAASRQAAVAMLFALVIARQVAARMESGSSKEKVFQDLEPWIASIIKDSYSETGGLPCAQGEGVSPVATLSLVFQRFTEAVREDFLRMADQVLRSGPVVSKLRDEASRETVDGPQPRGPVASPLAGVISHSSSLHDCWFW